LPDLDSHRDSDSDFTNPTNPSSSYANSLYAIDPSLLEQSSTYPFEFPDGQLSDDQESTPTEENQPQDLDDQQAFQSNFSDYTDVAHIEVPASSMAAKFSQYSGRGATMDPLLRQNIMATSHTTPQTNRGMHDNFILAATCWPWLKLQQNAKSGEAKNVLQVAIAAGSEEYFGRLRRGQKHTRETYSAYYKLLRTLRHGLEQAGDWTSATAKRDATLLLTACFSVLVVEVSELEARCSFLTPKLMFCRCWKGLSQVKEPGLCTFERTLRS
jgi:hypothetical protein